MAPLASVMHDADCNETDFERQRLVNMKPLTLFQRGVEPLTLVVSGEAPPHVPFAHGSAS